MTLTTQKLVQGMCLVLFTASSIVSLIKPTTQSAVIAGLSIVGFLVYQALEQLKRPVVADHSDAIKSLQDKNTKLEADFQHIKDNISTASAATMLRRK
jgi:hypothetical protein